MQRILLLFLAVILLSLLNITAQSNFFICYQIDGNNRISVLLFGDTQKCYCVPKKGWRSRVHCSNWAVTSHLVSFASTHKHAHKAVQTWQAQQDTAYFLLIIYSLAQHTLAGTSYRANIYSQHSSISLTKLFSSSVLCLFTTPCSGHIGSISQFWCCFLWTAQILLRGEICVTEDMSAWAVLFMSGQNRAMFVFVSFCRF